MTIRNLVVYGAAVMMVILLACGVIGTLRINEIRMGGPIQTKAQQASDLVADILPPPIYVIEPYLEASGLMRNPASVEAVAQRITKLHADYDTRHAYWLKSDLISEIREKVTKGADAPAQTFWTELEERLIPAARAGDQAGMEASFAALSDAYAQHRASIDEAVKAAIAYQATLNESASSRLKGSMLLLGTLAAMLFALVGSFCVVILVRVVRPIRHVTAHMKAMAQGVTPVDTSDAERTDEIGDVARALQSIVVYVETQARESSERELARQQHVVSTLGIALSRMKDGALHHRIDEAFPGEYAQLRDNYNAAASAMQDTISQVFIAAENLNTSASEISSATQDLSERTEHQAASLEETASAMDQLTEKVQDTADAATKASQSVGSAEQEAQANATIVRSAVEAMSGIEKSAQDIARITQVIDDLAFQTNLLSLNASVEAARAGDAGKSFAVVAEEVRALALRSAGAAMDIRSLISESTRQVDGGVKLVGQTGEVLEAIMGRVTEVSGLISCIADAAGEQAEGLSQINGAIGNMDQMTQQNAAMGEECNAAARVLHNEAERLNRLVGRFALDHGERAADISLRAA